MKQRAANAGQVAGLKERVRAWCVKLRVKPTQIRVQVMTRKWGSCSTRGWVCFATDLLDEPEGFQDYAIVHELLHLKVPNHGKLFKTLMSAHLPGWKEMRSLARVVERRAHA